MVRYLQRKGKRETENVIETERGGERMVEKDGESQKLVEMFRTTFSCFYKSYLNIKIYILYPINFLCLTYRVSDKTGNASNVNIVNKETFLVM